MHSDRQSRTDSPGQHGFGCVRVGVPLHTYGHAYANILAARIRSYLMFAIRNADDWMFKGTTGERALCTWDLRTDNIVWRKVPLSCTSPAYCDDSSRLCSVGPDVSTTPCRPSAPRAFTAWVSCKDVEALSIGLSFVLGVFTLAVLSGRSTRSWTSTNAVSSTTKHGATEAPRCLTSRAI
jgi:hypothetical protein